MSPFIPSSSRLIENTHGKGASKIKPTKAVKGTPSAQRVPPSTNNVYLVSPPALKIPTTSNAFRLFTGKKRRDNPKIK